MNLYKFIFGSVAFLIQLYYEKYLQEDLDLTLAELEKDDNLPRIKVYDFIIVGGGGAGCVIANRLSKHYDVLLLEAGGNPVPATEPPAFYPDVAEHPSINYEFYSVPQLYASLSNGGIIKCKTGKMLGGSTSHNGLVYNRGHPLIYNNWASSTNDDSWTYQNILKYFKKSENFIGEGVRSQHGHGGPMTVDTNHNPILSTWFLAGSELGFQTNLDPNGPQTEGFATCAVMRKEGHRVSTYTAFIRPIEKFRKSLRIERYSEATEVLINKNKRAYGIAYTRHQIPQIAHALKEIILSCGTFGTPILLLKSGIGPLSILKEAGIPVVANLPVGRGLQDHFAVSLKFTFKNKSLYLNLEKEVTEDSVQKYQNNGDAIFKYGIVETQSFILSSKAKRSNQPNIPDLQISFGDGFNSGVPIRGDENSTIFTIVLTKSNARGTIQLNSTSYKTGIRSMESLALIDYNAFSKPNDVDILVEGIKLALTIGENTTAFQQLGASYQNTHFPRCVEYQFRSDEYWRCYIHQTSVTLAHATSSCRMGFGPLDENAVVDSKLNVLGIFNLKVIDASIMPHITNANIMSPTIMIAEKASAEILKTWKSKLLQSASG